MGCSAAKNVKVESFETTTTSTTDDVRKISIPKSVSDLPMIEGTDPPTEFLDAANINNFQKAPNGMSFEIFLEDNYDDNEEATKKLPPKRFQKLAESSDNIMTLGKLQEKLEEAEIRRQQILMQRMQSANYRKHMKKQNSSNFLEYDPDILEPTENIKTK